MKYLQLFETTKHPWTGEPRQSYILWSADGMMLDYGSGYPIQTDLDDKVVRLRPIIPTKIVDFERTVEAAKQAVMAQESPKPGED